MRRIFLPCAQGKARQRNFLIFGIYDQAVSNRGPYHQQWVGSFPLLEYKMVWMRCRFDTPGNLISPEARRGQRVCPLHCHLVAVIDYSYSLQNTLMAAAAAA